jgi:hypothetical protein
MIGESDQVTLQALIRRDGIDEVREAVARAHAEAEGYRVIREGTTYGVIEPAGDIGAGTFATATDAWAAVMSRMGYVRDRLPMPDSAYIVAVGNPVDGFGFTGPFEGRDAADDWAHDNERYLDGDWTLAPLALPGEADPPAPDYVAALRGLLACPDLNLEELDPATLEAIDKALAALRDG